MNLLPATQMGEEHDVGPRDENGREHGLWSWLKDIRYLDNAAAEPFNTKMMMRVEYDHGIIVRALLRYDITGQHTKSWEEGRAISRPDHWVKSMNDMPFKRGLWRGKDKNGQDFVRMYGELCIAWEYRYEGFRSAVIDANGGFLNWVDDPGVRSPPPADEWPLDWDPYLRNTVLQKQWVPPSKLVDRRTGLELS